MASAVAKFLQHAVQIDAHAFKSVCILENFVKRGYRHRPCAAIQDMRNYMFEVVRYPNPTQIGHTR